MIIIKIFEITEDNDFNSLKKPWNDIIKRYDVNNVFLTWEWASTWWKHFKSNRSLCMVIIEENNEIVLIAPLVKSKYVLNHFMKIELLGSPDSDYNGLLISNNYHKYVLLLYNYLQKKYFKSHFISLKDVPKNNKYLEYLYLKSGQSKHITYRNTSKCPFLILPDTYSEFSNSLKKKFIKNIRSRENGLRKKGELCYKTHHDFQSIEKCMNILYYLNRKRFKDRKTIGYFDNDKTRNFHVEIAKKFDKKSWLQIGFLTLDNKPIAVEYSFKYNNNLYAYQSGFDPEYSKYGPGRLCELYHIKNMIEEKVKRYDWTRGFEHYIKDYTSQYDNNVEFTYFGNKSLSSLYKKKLLLEILIKKTFKSAPYKIRSNLSDIGIRI